MSNFLPASNTDSIKSQDRQAQGAQPDNTPVGGQPGQNSGGGTVTSVGVTMPPEFNVANSPVTTNGTIAVTKANEVANTFWAGPTTGPAGQPTFRALVSGDLPNGIGAGTVTSVAVGNLPPVFTANVANSTTAVSITFTANTQTANTVFAGPTTGAAASPTFRALVANDLPAGLLTNPMTTLGDIIYENATPSPARLPGNTAAHRQRLMQTGTGSISAVPAWTDSNEVYVSDWASFSAAVTQANSIGAVLVLDTNVTIGSNIAVAPPIRVAEGIFTLNSGQTLTINGGIEAPLTQIFTGSGTAVLNAATKVAWPEWWGALGGVSTNDDGTGINAAITACGTTTTLSFANKTYYLKTSITISQGTPIMAMPNAQIEPASSSPATNGITIGNFNYGCHIVLPALTFFTGYAIRLQGTSLLTMDLISITGGGTITSHNLSGSAVGLECYFTSGAPVLDNTINIWNSISMCGSAAIKMTCASDAGLAQGNVITSNFVINNNCAILFGGSPATSNECTSNEFIISGGMETGGLNNATGINNQSGVEVQLNKFYMMGFWGNGAGGSPTGTASVTGNVSGNKNFDGCDFHSEGSWQFTNTYADIVNVETSTTFGNRWYSEYSTKAPNIGSAGIPCPTTPNNRGAFYATNTSSWVANTAYVATNTVQDSGIGYVCIANVSGATHPASDPTHWSAGIPYFSNNLPLQFTIPVGGLGPGAFQAFYGYSPYVQGNARLTIKAYGQISQGGFLIEDSNGAVALPTQLFDHSGSNANEFKIGLRNMHASSTIAANTVLLFTVQVGI